MVLALRAPHRRTRSGIQSTWKRKRFPRCARDTNAVDLVREYCKTLVGKQAKTKALVEEGKVTDRHFAEEDALERRLYGSPDAVSEEEEEEEEEEEKEEEDAGVREERRGKNVDEERQRDEKKQGPTKAQKRREKKAQEEKARELAIEMERARLRESGPSKKRNRRRRECDAKALEAQNLKLREVKADGHCLYRAVAEQVAEMREESRYGEVRIMCANEMLKNREEYEAFVEVEEAGSFEKYCEKGGIDGGVGWPRGDVSYC